MDPSQRTVVAVDLGGTKIRSLVVDGLGRIKGVDQRPTDAREGKEHVIGHIVQSVQAACGACGIDVRQVEAIGVDVPGPVDFERGILLDAPNLPGWQNVALGPILTERLGPRSCLENDANAAAVGEHRFGAGRGTRHMLYLTVSTGIGGGIIIDGKLYRGADGTAGELGHIVVDPAGPQHNCGMTGCLEVMSSGTAIARMAQEAVRAGRSPMLAEAVRDGMLSSKEVSDAAHAGDAAAQEILATAARYLGFGLANYINIFNPEVFVIGGGASQIFDLLIQPAWDSARSMAWERPARRARLERAALGGDSGALGMAALALDLVAGDAIDRAAASAGLAGSSR
ncbi:MAG: ROK family protein [Chloroflexota bacterium]